MQRDYLRYNLLYYCKSERVIAEGLPIDMPNQKVSAVNPASIKLKALWTMIGPNTGWVVLA